MLHFSYLFWKTDFAVKLFTIPPPHCSRQFVTSELDYFDKKKNYEKCVLMIVFNQVAVTCTFVWSYTTCMFSVECHFQLFVCNLNNHHISLIETITDVCEWGRPWEVLWPRLIGISHRENSEWLQFPPKVPHQGLSFKSIHWIAINSPLAGTVWVISVIWNWNSNNQMNRRIINLWPWASPPCSNWEN